jgi:hypothetical protein
MTETNKTGRVKNRVLQEILDELDVESREKLSFPHWSNWGNWQNWLNWYNWNNWGNWLNWWT